MDWIWLIAKRRKGWRERKGGREHKWIDEEKREKKGARKEWKGGKKEGEKGERDRGREGRNVVCMHTHAHIITMYLELIPLDDPSLYVVLDLPQNGEHGDVGLAGTSRSRDEKILTRVVGNIKHYGLDTVQSLGT